MKMNKFKMEPEKMKRLFGIVFCFFPPRICIGVASRKLVHRPKWKTKEEEDEEHRERSKFDAIQDPVPETRS